MGCGGGGRAGYYDIVGPMCTEDVLGEGGCRKEGMIEGGEYGWQERVLCRGVGIS